MPSPPTESLLADTAWMRALARHLLADADGAEDLVQETWVIALEKRGASGRPPRAWLAGVLRHLTLRHAEGRRHRSDRERAAAREEAVDDATRLAERVERQRLVAGAVLALPDHLRTVVLLRWVEELPPAAIARRLGIPGGTVRARLHRARGVLREELDRRLGGERGTWAGALAALAGRPGRATTIGAGWLAPVGALLMTKTWITLAASALAGLAMFGIWRGIAPGGRSVGALAEPRIAVPGSPEISGAEPEPDLVHETPAAREPAPSGEPEARSAGTNPLPAVAAGWWLVGRVHAPGAEPGPNTRLRVRADWNVDWLVQARVDERVEVDLGPFFDDGRHLPRVLTVELDRPGFLPRSVELTLTREERQAGFRPDGRGEVDLEIELAPASITVAGRARVSHGAGATALRAALFAPDDLTRVMPPPPVDVTACDAEGRFVLRAPASGAWVAVVYVPEAARGPDAPRPATRAVELVADERRDLGTLDLEAGLAIRGRLQLAALEAGMGATVRARREDRCGDWLTWTGERFEHGAAGTRCGEDGAFALGGLGPVEYVLELRDVSFLGEDLRSTYGGDHYPAMRVRAPAEGVLFAPDLALTVLRVTGRGAPLAEVPTLVEGDGWGYERQTTPEGRLAVWHAPEEEVRALLDAPGYARTTRTIHPREGTASIWFDVELEPVARAELVLLVEGDEERRAERLCIELVPLDESEGAERERAERHVLRRGRGPLTLPPLTPGRYAVSVVPSAVEPGDYVPAPGVLVQEARFEVELAPGARTEVRVPLARGAGVRMVGDPEVHAVVALRDASGARLSMGARGPGGGWSTRGATVDVNGGSALFPALPPGTYVLEVIGELDGPSPVEVPLVLRAGEVVEVELARYL